MMPIDEEQVCIHGNYVKLPCVECASYIEYIEENEKDVRVLDLERELAEARREIKNLLTAQMNSQLLLDIAGDAPVPYNDTLCMSLMEAVEETIGG